MGEPQDVCELTDTDEERHLIRCLRHSPQSVTTVAEALGISRERTQAVVQRLDRTVGLLRLFRSDTLCDGLAE
jgi:predicted ArsR family transcriptional regulator